MHNDLPTIAFLFCSWTSQKKISECVDALTNYKGGVVIVIYAGK